MNQRHGYGPSLRWLWVEAKHLGQSDQEACASVIHWARHQPEAWAVEDQRKKNGLAQDNQALGEYHAPQITWSPTGNHDHHCGTEFADQSSREMLNAVR